MDFYWHYSNKDTIDASGKDCFVCAIKVAVQVFRSITEYIQVRLSIVSYSQPDLSTASSLLLSTASSLLLSTASSLLLSTASSLLLSTASSLLLSTASSLLLSTASSLLLSTALPSSSYSLRFPPSHPPYDIDFLFFSPSSLSYSSLSSLRLRYNLDRVRVQEINWHWLTADFGMLSEASSIYLRTCRISCPR